ncbi:MAG: sulfurtransferase [Gracilibacter sp. BRH_c7a]|nr:MAG: sulfurtransferase [Gracilibacter sp. BRH_c7a]
MTPSEAKQRLDSGEGLVFLDVRTMEEYEAGHIKDSILIPVNTIEAEVEATIQDKKKPIFVYCRSGNRSAVAADILVKLGYENVFNLGGINNWPYEVEKKS